MTSGPDVLAADLAANGFTAWTWREAISPASRCRIMRYQRRLRRLEMLTVQHGLIARIRQAVIWRVHLRAAANLGFSVPLNTCGPGLSIAHYGTLVINAEARVGNGCRIHPGVVIGRSDTGTPVIGDRCYIGAGAKIYGGITVGSEVVIAPNAVVDRDVEANSVVGGVPARVIRSGVDYRWRD